MFQNILEHYRNHQVKNIGTYKFGHTIILEQIRINTSLKLASPILYPFLFYFNTFILLLSFHSSSCDLFISFFYHFTFSLGSDSLIRISSSRLASSTNASKYPWLLATHKKTSPLLQKWKISKASFHHYSWRINDCFQTYCYGHDQIISRGENLPQYSIHVDKCEG